MVFGDPEMTHSVQDGSCGFCCLFSARLALTLCEVFWLGRATSPIKAKVNHLFWLPFRKTTWTPSTQATAFSRSGLTLRRRAPTLGWGLWGRPRKRSARWATKWRLDPWPSLPVRMTLDFSAVFLGLKYLISMVMHTLRWDSEQRWII